MAIPTTNKNLYNPALSRAVASTVANFYPLIGSIPFQPIASERFSVRQVTGLGGSQWASEGDTLSTAKNASAWGKVDYQLKTQIADIELDNYQINGALSAGENLLARAVSARTQALADALAASVYSTGKISGSFATTKQTLPLRALVDASNDINGARSELSFEMLDALLLKVGAKGGQADFITMPDALYVDYQTLWRSLGGTVPTDVWTNPYTNATRTVIVYNGIPVFRTNQLTMLEENDGTVPTDDDYDNTGTGGNTATNGSIYAGTFDSGDEGSGIAFKYFANTDVPQDALGMTFEYGGLKESTNQKFWRFNQSLELVTHHKHAVARVHGVQKNV